MSCFFVFFHVHTFLASFSRILFGLIFLMLVSSLVKYLSIFFDLEIVKDMFFTETFACFVRSSKFCLKTVYDHSIVSIADEDIRSDVSPVLFVATTPDTVQIMAILQLALIKIGQLASRPPVGTRSRPSSGSLID